MRNDEFKEGDIVVIVKECYCDLRDCPFELNLITEFIKYGKGLNQFEYCRISLKGWENGGVYFSSDKLRKATKREAFLYYIFGQHILGEQDGL